MNYFSIVCTSEAEFVSLSFNCWRADSLSEAFGRQLRVHTEFWIKDKISNMYTGTAAHLSCTLKLNAIFC